MLKADIMRQRHGFSATRSLTRRPAQRSRHNVPVAVAAFALLILLGAGCGKWGSEDLRPVRTSPDTSTPEPSDRLFPRGLPYDEAFSPDHRRRTYIVRTLDDQTMYVDGGGCNLSFAGNAFPLAFSPNSQYLLFVAAPNDLLHGLYILPLDTCGPGRRLTNRNMRKGPAPLPADHLPVPITRDVRWSDHSVSYSIPGTATVEVNIETGQAIRRAP